MYIVCLMPLYAAEHLPAAHILSAEASFAESAQEAIARDASRAASALLARVAACPRRSRRSARCRPTRALDRSSARPLSPMAAPRRVSDLVSRFEGAKDSGPPTRARASPATPSPPRPALPLRTLWPPPGVTVQTGSDTSLSYVPTTPTEVRPSADRIRADRAAGGQAARDDALGAQHTDSTCATAVRAHDAQGRARAAESLFRAKPRLERCASSRLCYENVAPLLGA